MSMMLFYEDFRDNDAFVDAIEYIEYFSRSKLTFPVAQTIRLLAQH